MWDSLISNWLEITAVVSGLAYIFLSIKQKISCWFFGIVSSLLYMYICFVSKIYADMALQTYYVAMGIYGWMHWARLDDSTEKELPVVSISKKQLISLSGITLVLFLITGNLLKYYTDSPVPWIDAFTTALSITATWMLTRKILEHWVIWVIVDAVSIGLYFYRELYFTIILFVVYSIMAVLGYFEWKKVWIKDRLTPVL